MVDGVENGDSVKRYLTLSIDVHCLKDSPVPTCFFSVKTKQSLGVGRHCLKDSPVPTSYFR